MTNELTVRDDILIEAAPSRVWEVLVNPTYVAQWDELPEDYPSDNMTVGSKVVWDHPNGDQTITTVIKAEENTELVIALYGSIWKKQPKKGDVAYRYRLEQRDSNTLLKIEIGDFSLLANGRDYYDASVEFAAVAKQTIKKLTEED